MVTCRFCIEVKQTCFCQVDSDLRKENSIQYKKGMGLNRWVRNPNSQFPTPNFSREEERLADHLQRELKGTEHSRKDKSHLQ